MTNADSATVLREGLGLAHWTVMDLWFASVGVGGGFTTEDIAHILDGTALATQVGHDVLAAALNDHFVAHGMDHPVLYWRDLLRN